jgi:hypothetical protein
MLPAADNESPRGVGLQDLSAGTESRLHILSSRPLGAAVVLATDPVPDIRMKFLYTTGVAP